MSDRIFETMRGGVTFCMAKCPHCGGDIDFENAETEVLDEGVIGYNMDWTCRDCGRGGASSFYAELTDITLKDEDGDRIRIFIREGADYGI